MLVRLAFAVAVCVQPDILIVDEALAVGDASFQFKCLYRLEAQTQQGTTLLFVSHDMGMVKRFCNRVIYLREGKVRASGSPEEMAELYLLEMRDEQRRWASGGTVPVAPKPFLAKQGGSPLARMKAILLPPALPTLTACTRALCMAKPSSCRPSA